MRSELDITKDVSAGAVASFERAKGAADAKSSAAASVIAQLMSEAEQLRTAIASKENDVALLKVPSDPMRARRLPADALQATVAELELAARSSSDAAAHREALLQLKADALQVRTAASWRRCSRLCVTAVRRRS
jgi:hypothetical protein